MTLFHQFNISIFDGATGATVTGLPVGINFNIASGFVTISGTPTASITTTTVYSFAVTTTGSCSNSSLLGTITVDPDDDLDLLSAVGTDAQVLCETEPITDIVYQFSRWSFQCHSYGATIRSYFWN